MLYLTNTLGGKKELFIPLHTNKVLLYVCGITPYSPAHIGHGRCYVSFDILVRLLRFLGYEVVYCRNFTDIDDKLLNKAEQEFGDASRYLEIAHKNIDLYHADMKALNCLAPTYEPRVTHSIDMIIEFITQLIRQGYAYQSDGSVYFHIPSFSAYGKLSHQNVDDVRSGVRIEVRENKKDPLDFVLWKSEQAGICWPSPWGPGRPGWHIECSAMAQHYLGDQIDIHAGGLDLIFPHHENEIAQSESIHGQFARYWLHNGLVTIGQEKMAKSIGNVFLLQDIHKKCDPIVLRYYILTHHYRSPLEFSWENMEGAQKAYQRLVNAFADIDSRPVNLQESDNYPLIGQMISALCDDLNTPAFFGLVFEHLSMLHTNATLKSYVKYLLQEILGLPLAPLHLPEVIITPEMQSLIDLRQKARHEKNWALSDQLRDQLQELGYAVQDKKIQ